MLSAGNDTIQDFAAGTSVRSILLDFEDMLSGTSLDGYKGLHWDSPWGLPGGYAVDPSLYPDTGFPVVLTSGTNVGAADYLGRFSSSEDFDFVSGNFSCYYTYFDSEVTINAYDDGSLVGSAYMGLIGGLKAEVDFLNGTANYVNYANFSGTFVGVDTIEFIPTYGQLAMDDLVLNFGMTEADKIDVPDGFDIAQFIASAESHGNGGTILSHADGTLTLVGVDPATVAPEWFI